MEQETIENFCGRLFSTVARQRIEKMIRGQTLSLKEKEELTKEQALGEYISIIMLWSSMGSFFLKLHFNMDVAKKLAAGALLREEHEVPDEMALDFMKECSNGVGGYVRSLFESNDILLGMSLPFLAEGHDELIFRKIIDSRARVYEWHLFLEDGSSLAFTTELCLLTPGVLQNKKDTLEAALIESDNEQSSAGDVEFLF